jgi:hypothetical protein
LAIGELEVNQGGSQMFVIGVAGQAQNGKDTVADRLWERLNSMNGVIWKRGAFAANVKKVYCDTFGVDMAFVEKWKVVPEAPPGFAMSVRQALQFIGDGFRQIQPKIWLDLAFREKCPKIISDVRYVNEFLRVKSEGGLNVLIGRPDKINDDPNGSEAQIRPYVDWCLKHCPRKLTDLRDIWQDLKMIEGFSDNVPPLPDGIEEFDIFIRNDGTKEELCETVDKQLVPFVRSYVFEFNDAVQETKCLISA